MPKTLSAPPDFTIVTSPGIGDDVYLHYQDQNTGNIYGTWGINSAPPEYSYDANTGTLFTTGDPTTTGSAHTTVNPSVTGEALANPYIKELGYGAENAGKAQELYDTLQTDPHKFYTTIASDLANKYLSYSNANIYGNWTDELANQLESIKSIDPNAYYSAKLDLLGQQTGWATTNGSPAFRAAYEKNIQDMLPGALSSGISVDQINSTLNNSFNVGAQGGSQYAANTAASGGGGFNFGRDILPGIMFVGGSALGAYGLDSALSAAAAAQAAGNVGGYMASAGLNPGVFEGSLFTMPELAGVAAPIAESTYTSPTDYMNQANLNPGTFNNFTPINPLTDYMNQAGLNSGTFSGQQFQMPTNLTAADALKTANQVRQVAGTANSLSKLLTQGGGAGAAGSALTGAAQNLATGQTGVGSAIPALVRGNQNPFLQSAQQPIRSSSPDLAQLANLLKQG